MALPILSADERLAQPRGIKGCIFGKSGIGKTSLLWTLPQETTLFFDLEAGDLAVEGWQGHTLRPRTWSDCRDYAVFIGGPNPALRKEQPYSQEHFDAICERFGSPEMLDRYDTVFIDSITVAARLCFQWCKGQDQAFSDKSGKPDIRGAYGLHGQEMIAWLTHLQHARTKNIWFVGILDEKMDDFHRRLCQLQIEGNKTGLELPGIVDQVITMAEGKQGDKPYRKFVCHTLNPDGYPAKDRSGRLNCDEEPHLGRLMEKIKRPLTARADTLTFEAVHDEHDQCDDQHGLYNQSYTRRPIIMTYLNSTPTSVNSSSQSPKGMSYNDAKSQGEYDLIPKGTIARVMMGIKPGGYSDPEKGWHDGYATYKSGSEAVYLNCEFMVLDGPYRGRKIWSLIGLHSPKGDQWFQMGRSFIKGILNSARGFSEKDTSEAAVAARYISSFKDLHGLEFVASIDVDRNKESGEDKNVIKLGITKDHKDYPGHDSGYYAGTSSSSSAPWAR